LQHNIRTRGCHNRERARYDYHICYYVALYGGDERCINDISVGYDEVEHRANDPLRCCAGWVDDDRLYSPIMGDYVVKPVPIVVGEGALSAACVSGTSA